MRRTGIFWLLSLVACTTYSPTEELVDVIIEYKQVSHSFDLLLEKCIQDNPSLLSLQTLQNRLHDSMQSVQNHIEKLVLHIQGMRLTLKSKQTILALLEQPLVPE